MFTLSPFDVDSPFADELRAFAQAEAAGTVPRGAVLFCGSSSIRLWATLAADFAEYTVLNRGFGGSTLAESVAEMDWLICGSQPRAIVLYAGENDLDHGAHPEEVVERFAQFMTRVGERLGAELPVFFLSVKPSPARRGNIERVRQTNALLREALPRWPQVCYIDVFTAMMDGNRPRQELFCEDWLHLSAVGYKLWAQAVRTAFAEAGLQP